MRIHVLADLHNEFGVSEIPETDADVVILAGDVDVGLDGLSYAKFMFPKQTVLYVAGNHEYYGKSIPHLKLKLRAGAHNSNVRFLEEDEVVVGNVRFLGCTLWTDFDLSGVEQRRKAMALAASDMNDFRQIHCGRGTRTLTPRDSLRFHVRSRAWLTAQLAKPWDGPTVVVTHHAPSQMSIAPAYRADLLSAAFASDLDQLIIDTAPTLWVHGHTHHCVDYRIGRTRVLSNQRGYPREKLQGFVPGLVVDLSALSG